MVHVFALSDTCNEEPQSDHNEYAFPCSVGNLVPHLLIEVMDLLDALHVVETGWSIGNCPYAQIVHVCENFPVVAEGGLLTSLEELVLVFGLTVAVRETHVVSKSKSLSLKELEFVHFINNLLKYYKLILFHCLM